MMISVVRSTHFVSVSNKDGCSANLLVEERLSIGSHLNCINYIRNGSCNLIKDPDLQTFVIEVIKRFSPQNLQTRGDLSTTPQPIPEAQFQQEFYRACCVYTRGCVTTFPECGTPKGRIDFFIRSKKWGVELLRDGVRLLGHNSRFTAGEYGTWLHDGTMKDYIMIDFRSKKPTRTRDGKQIITTRETIIYNYCRYRIIDICCFDE
jgi:hypothetical protein